MLQLSLVDTLVPADATVVGALWSSARRHLILQILPSESQVIDVRMHSLARASVVHEGTAGLCLAVDTPLGAILAHGPLLRAVRKVVDVLLLGGEVDTLRQADG